METSLQTKAINFKIYISLKKGFLHILNVVHEITPSLKSPFWSTISQISNYLPDFANILISVTTESSIVVILTHVMIFFFKFINWIIGNFTYVTEASDNRT